MACTHVFELFWASCCTDMILSPLWAPRASSALSHSPVSWPTLPLSILLSPQKFSVNFNLSERNGSIVFLWLLQRLLPLKAGFCLSGCLASGGDHIRSEQIFKTGRTGRSCSGEITREKVAVRELTVAIPRLWRHCDEYHPNWGPCLGFHLW